MTTRMMTTAIRNVSEADFAMEKKSRVVNPNARKRRPKTKCGKLFAFYPWVGGKHYVKNWLKDKVPAKFGTYYEPFLGAGSMWLELKPEKCVINDINPYLPLMFYCVKYHLDRFVNEISEISNTYDRLGKTGFDNVLALFNRTKIVIPHDYVFPTREVPSMVKQAARFLYLLKRCHNANVTLSADGTIKCAYWSARQRIVLCNRALFKAIHDYLVAADITFLHGDYLKAIKSCRKGDFVYFDPPYFENKMKSELYPYHYELLDHTKFLRQVKKLSTKGVHVAMTNKFHPFIVDTFKNDDPGETKFHVVHMRNVRGWAHSHNGILYRSDVFVTNYNIDIDDVGSTT